MNQQVMKFYLVVVAFSIFVCSCVVINMKVPNSCDYKGGFSKIMLDKAIKKYHLTIMELGEDIISIEVDSCVLRGNQLKLWAKTIKPISEPNKLMQPFQDVSVLKATRVKNSFSITDTLTITDKKGVFFIKVKIDKLGNEYLIIPQNDNTGICYKLTDFMP